MSTFIISQLEPTNGINMHCWSLNAGSDYLEKLFYSSLLPLISFNNLWLILNTSNLNVLSSCSGSTQPSINSINVVADMLSVSRHGNVSLHSSSSFNSLEKYFSNESSQLSNFETITQTSSLISLSRFCCFKSLYKYLASRPSKSDRTVLP